MQQNSQGEKLMFRTKHWILLSTLLGSFFSPALFATASKKTKLLSTPLPSSNCLITVSKAGALRALPGEWKLADSYQGGMGAKGRFVVVSSRKSPLMQVYDTKTGKVRSVPDEYKNAGLGGVSEDGRTLYVTGDSPDKDSLVRIHLDSGESETLVSTGKFRGNSKLSRNKRYLLYLDTAFGTQATVVDLKTNTVKEYRLKMDHVGPSHRVGEISDDGTLIRVDLSAKGVSDRYAFRTNHVQDSSLSHGNALELSGQKLQNEWGDKVSVWATTGEGNRLVVSDKEGWRVSEFSADGKSLQTVANLRGLDELRKLAQKFGISLTGYDWFSAVKVKDVEISPNGRFVSVLGLMEQPSKDFKPIRVGSSLQVASGQIEESPFVLRWDVNDRSGKPVLNTIAPKAKGGGAFDLSQVKVFNNGRVLVAGANPREYFVWDSSKGFIAADRKYDPEVHPWSQAVTLEFSADGTQLMISDRSGTVVHDVKSLWSSPPPQLTPRKIRKSKRRKL